MSVIKTGDYTEPTTATYTSNFMYKYPDKMDLRPGSKLHNLIIQRVMLRAKNSYSAMQRRHKTWNKIDEMMTAYIPLSAEETNTKTKDPNRPVSIIVPYSYANLETILAYQSKAFLSSPIYSYEGVGPEDTIGAKLLELIVNQQARRYKHMLALHTGFRDGLTYGIHASYVTWNTRRGHKVRSTKQPLFDIQGNVIGEEDKKENISTILFEGNRIKNIDPYKYLPDVSVSAENIQDGEFTGWYETENIFNLLTEEASGDIFNVKYVKQELGQGMAKSIFDSDASRRDRFGIRSNQGNSSERNYSVFLTNMYINIIPKDWGLPGSEGNRSGTNPEKWFFLLANDKIVVDARPLGLNHNMFPVAVNAPDYDGYSVAPISRIEMSYGLQEVLNWVFNCYDDQTEVLTDRGWVYLSNTTEEDKVATVDPISNNLWFEKPKQWFAYDYDGFLLNFKSTRMDICVTPNHDMFAKPRYKGDWEFIPAVVLATQADKEYKTLGNVNWEGEPAQSIHLGGKQPIRDRGDIPRYTDIEIEPMVLAGFLGWFLSEGSISHGASSGSYAVAIKQSKKDHIDDIFGLMKSMPFHVTITYDANKDATQWTITDKRFYEWLKEHCYIGGTHSEHKKVPDFVRNWDEFHLKLLFDRAMWGDGYWMPGHENLGRYGSKSKELVDGMQEIALKLGYFSHTKETTTPLGLPFYTLNISTAETHPTIASRNCFKVNYTGKVYCFENSTHLTITRRNGKVAIQGQSHIANVRKALNDMFIVDPSLINMEDMANPTPGKLIRLRKHAWGRGVEGAVKQFNVQDVTRGNIQDASFVMDLMQKVNSSSDAAMGAARGGERRSAAEFSGTFNSLISRLEHLSSITSTQYLQDIAYLCASHTQQLMTKETYVRAVGDWPEVLMAEFGNAGGTAVSPFDIQAEFDVMYKDGSTMNPDASVLQFWNTMFGAVTSDPELRQAFDIHRIFKHMARMSGAKNVNEFIKQTPINAQVMPDEVVAQQAAAGNIIPA